jgi:hypothetical protein
VTEVKSYEPTGYQVAKFMYRYCESNTGKIKEERELRWGCFAAELIEDDGEENAYAKPDNRAHGSFFWTRRRQNS